MAGIRNRAVREVLWPLFPGETQGWMCAPREMCFLACAGDVCSTLGKTWAESCRWRKVDFQFCVLSASSPTPPSSLGARRVFTWGVWRISGVLQDVCLITCARDVGTRRIHLALIIEFFRKNIKCSLESENKMVACTTFFDTVCYFVIAVIPGWKLWVNREPQKYRQMPVCKKKRRKAEVRGAAFVLCLNFRWAKASSSAKLQCKAYMASWEKQFILDYSTTAIV